MRLLLDKGFVRRLLEGLARVDLAIPLTPEQKTVLEVLREIFSEELYITHGTSGILRHRFSVIQNTKIIFSITKPLFPTKYCRRWARRIRAFGFEREDADMLSLASFGTDKLSGGTFLGVHQIITPDKRFVKRFQENQHLINQHSRQWLGI